MMSLEFVKSQVAYYRKNLRCGPSRDWNLISGLLLKYEQMSKPPDNV